MLKVYISLELERKQRNISMGKAILMSIQPKWVAKILNGEKTIEVRKKFPKDYVGWVYIYCTKNIGKHGENQLLNFFKGNEYFIGKDIDNYNPNDICYLGQNGKVVAKFWCDDVSNIVMGLCPRTRNMPIEDQENELQTIDFEEKELCAKACLTMWELHDYFNSVFEKSNNWWKETFGYAIHISKLEVFDKPRELKEFKVKGFERIKVLGSPYGDLDSVAYHYYKKPILNPLEKAPQNWCYVEE